MPAGKVERVTADLEEGTEMKPGSPGGMPLGQYPGGNTSESNRGVEGTGRTGPTAELAGLRRQHRGVIAAELYVFGLVRGRGGAGTQVLPAA